MMSRPTLLSRVRRAVWQGLLLTSAFTGCRRDAVPDIRRIENRFQETRVDSFAGTRAGEKRTVAGIVLCWCPAGRFTMGSPSGESERRPGEVLVDVTFSKGFWIGRFEVT